MMTATKTRTAADLFAHFSPVVERIRALCPKQTTERGWAWRPLWLDAEHAVADGADDLSFGDDFDQVVAKTEAKLAEIEAKARQG